MTPTRIKINIIATLLLASALTDTADACPFCPKVSQTLSERRAVSDAVVLAQWTGGTPRKGEDAGRTVFEVVEVLKAPADAVAKKDRITLARYRTGKKGDLFLLFGASDGVLNWDETLEITETGWQYVAQAPSTESATSERLAYFLRFLEYPDPLIADDAFSEFAAAPYDDVVALKDRLPCKRIRGWVADPDTMQVRMGLYGLMLGLCGNPEDKEVFETFIANETADFRLGVDGVIGGYLVLTGDKGLDFIDRVKLKAAVVVDRNGEPVKDKEGKTQPQPVSELYASMQALRFMRTYASDRVSFARLKQSMRGLLDRPELADLVITDLARWKDWSVQERLIELYGKEEYDFPAVKRAIIQYTAAAARDVPLELEQNPPEHVVKAKKALEALKRKDPKTYRQVERFLPRPR